MRLILPGTFVKGATQYEYARQDEGQQRVTLQRPFYMAAHEVTVGQFAEFVNAMQQLDPNWKTEAERDGSSYAKGGQSTIGIGSARWVSDVNWKNPGFPQTSRHPVVFVSWNDAVAFCSWLSKREAKSYRLPTEAEWEYVARAGTTTAYWWGDDPAGGAGKANVVDASYERLYPGKQIPVGFDDGFAHTAPVGSFEPNAWGFYDVVGNVFEWVLDFWSVPTTVEAVNPTGPQSGTEKVAKGGGFGNRLDHNRSAFRFRDPPSARHAGLGFRVLLDVANTINP